MNKIIPLVEWPKEKGEYRIVQFWNKIEERPYLRFNEDEKYLFFHSDIVRKFAKDFEIEIEEISKGNESLVFLKENDLIAIVGMGWSNLNPEIKEGQFWGESKTYNWKIFGGHLERLNKFYPDWKFK